MSVSFCKDKSLIFTIERSRLYMEELLFEYDNFLIGRFSEISPECFEGVEKGGYNEKLAINCIRYAIEKVLNWDEDTAIQKFDEYIMHIMKLESMIRFIEFPPDVEEGNPRYILSKLYPKKIKMNQHDLTINTMSEVLEGKRSQFPRDYFVGKEGFRRYCYCIKYLLEVYEPFPNVESLYNYFSSPNGNVFLSKYKLKIPTYQYNLDILQAIRTITRSDPDSELYYHLCIFNKQYSKLSKKWN